MVGNNKKINKMLCEIFILPLIFSFLKNKLASISRNILSGGKIEKLVKKYYNVIIMFFKNCWFPRWGQKKNETEEVFYFETHFEGFNLHLGNK